MERFLIMDCEFVNIWLRCLVNDRSSVMDHLPAPLALQIKHAGVFAETLTAAVYKIPVISEIDLVA